MVAREDRRQLQAQPRPTRSVQPRPTASFSLAALRPSSSASVGPQKHSVATAPSDPYHPNGIMARVSAKSRLPKATYPTEVRWGYKSSGQKKGRHEAGLLSGTGREISTWPPPGHPSDSSRGPFRYRRPE